jgi:UDP-glucose 4-epimerase
MPMSADSKILVTGASGHLGQWIVAELTARGHDVVVASRKPTTAPTIAGLVWSRPVQAVPCDFGAADGLDALAPHLESLTGVVHSAAHVPAETAKNADEDADRTFAANAVGTARLLGMLAGATKLEALVYASTFEVYGPVHRLPVDEDHPAEPINYYGASKLAGEKYARLFGGDRKVACSSLRFPAIYGPGDTIKRAIGNFVRAAAFGGVIELQGDGADLRELVYAGDAARATVLALERRAEGIFNIGSGRGFSIREMAEAAQRVGGDAVTLVTRERVKDRVDYSLDVSRAKAAFGWEPTTSIDDGVAAQVAWLRAAQRGT